MTCKKETECKNGGFTPTDSLQHDPCMVCRDFSKFSPKKTAKEPMVKKMKPEHAQEIYDIIDHLDNLANENCIGDRDKIDEDVKRAKELLGLERLDVPEPGTIVEYVKGEYISWGKFEEIDEMDDIWILVKKPCF